MKRISKQLFVLSCTSLTVLATASAFAEQMAYAPDLEGGITASIGTFYAAPGANDQPYAKTIDLSNPPFTETEVYNNTEYDWGFEASLGYVFENTANGIELSYRGLDSSSDDNLTSSLGDGVSILPPGFPGRIPFDVASNELSNEFDAVDLMISQFLDIGDHVQMRFLAGLAYVKIEQSSNSLFGTTVGFYEGLSYSADAHSEFEGFGPRIGADARYDFGQGFGIVAGGTVAYFIGDLSTSNTTDFTATGAPAGLGDSFASNDIDNHSVLNLRGNVGIDYVYFFDNDEKSTLGLELGYLADYYIDAVNNTTSKFGLGTDGVTGVAVYSTESEMSSASYSGPYLLLKGAF